MEWIPAPIPINQNRESQAEAKTAIINGEAFFDTLSVELLQHYAEDAGKSSEEILSITEPEYVVAFTADGVIIQD